MRVTIEHRGTKESRKKALQLVHPMCFNASRCSSLSNHSARGQETLQSARENSTWLDERMRRDARSEGSAPTSGRSENGRQG